MIVELQTRTNSAELVSVFFDKDKNTFLKKRFCCELLSHTFVRYYENEQSPSVTLFNKWL